MKQYLSDYNIRINRPSLCSYCLAPSKGYLLHLGGRWYGCCSMEHQDKLKEKIQRGDKLPNTSITSEQGVDYAVTNTGDTFMQLAKKENTPNMLKWDRTSRLALFGRAIREYMNHQSALASEGLLDTRSSDD